MLGRVIECLKRSVLTRLFALLSCVAFPVLRVINCLSSVSLSRLPRNALAATRLDQYCEVILSSGSGSRKYILHN